MKLNLIGAAGILVLVAACDKSDYLSPEVTLETDQGRVTCQLYTTDRLYWDEATSHPDTMSAETADAYCKAAGRQRKAEAQG